MWKIAIILFFYLNMSDSSLQAIGNDERPFTFSYNQEKILATNPKVLSFLYHMTRHRLNLEEMANQYQLTSIEHYRAFLIENKLIAFSKEGEIEFLFTNPHGAWKLYSKQELGDGILAHLRKSGVDRLTSLVNEKTANKDDEVSPLWIANTYRLTPQEYKVYKQELFQIQKKYTDLGEHNLHSGKEHKVVWIVQLADCIEEERAKTSHLLFGSIEEF